jgi:hypothetical protein
MLDLRLVIGFLETRAAQMGSPALPCSAAVCSGRRDHWWPARDRHAPVKSSLRRARGGLAPAFFRREKAVAGLWGTDLLVGGFGGGACRTRAGLRRRQCYPPTCWVEFLLDLFVYSLVSRYNCLCVAQVLLEFSLLGADCNFSKIWDSTYVIVF